ncbi:hypothetical protein Y032_1413g3870 [Ancylostoma ceylanicum]|uniref:Uncharacterized protein n=1 Tax=Ancylostoma ceylanicum TaxID=53326 RepID=A0A016W570_9BILA|nr:hypothetical protein Y032_1413g3870 [Ancylostoma ceylanicum]
MGSQDGTNQGAVGASESPSRSKIRDVLGEIQLLQSSRNRVPSNTREEEKMGTIQENDENTPDHQQRNAFGTMG